MGVTSAMVAEPITYTFEGKEYKLSPWTVEVMAAFERYLEKKAFETYEKIASKMPASIAEKALAQLMQDITTGVYTFGTSTVGKALETPEYVRYIFFLCLKKNHPEVDMDLVRKMADVDYNGMIQIMNMVNADPNLKKPTEEAK